MVHDVSHLMCPTSICSQLIRTVLRKLSLLQG
nr:MAG TPA_asm: hypothetical protein [Caudoviricetes sp.]